MFIENVGQFPEDARFQLRGADRAIWLAQDALWITLWEPAAPTTLPHHQAAPLSNISTDTPRRGVNLRLSFAGANPAPLIHVSEPVSTTISYFYGNDPDAWRPDVPVWGNVRYVDLYPGLDLELAGQGSTLTPRLICHAPDCATALAAVQLEVTGAEELTLLEEGLLIETAVGEWRLPLLAVVDEEGRPVDANVAQAAVVGERVERPFGTGLFHSPLPVLNPQDENPAGSSLLYSTFLGGWASDDAFALATDEAGNVFVAGQTYGDFPTTPGAFETERNGSYDAFVTKINAAGSNLLYSTYLGGGSNYGDPGEDYGYDIAVDGMGNAYITGLTASPDFPLPPGPSTPLTTVVTLTLL